MNALNTLPFWYKREACLTTLVNSMVKYTNQAVIIVTSVAVAAIAGTSVGSPICLCACRFWDPATGGPDMPLMLNTCMDVAAGMAYLHQCGIIHSG
jgi:hypothetical protein